MEIARMMRRCLWQLPAAAVACAADAAGDTFTRVPRHRAAVPLLAAVLRLAALSAVGLLAGCDDTTAPPSELPAEIAVGAAPTAIAAAADWIAVGEVNFDFGSNTFGPGRVSWLDPDGGDLFRTTAVSVNPQRLLLAGAAGEYLVAVCTGDYGPTGGRLDVMDVATGTLLRSIEIGGQPSAAARGGGDTLWVGSFGESGVAAVDVATGALLRSWRPDAGFEAAALVAAGDGLVAADFDDDMVVELDSAGGVVGAVAVGDGPVALAVDPADPKRIYVVNSLDETAGVVDLRTQQFSRFPGSVGHAPNDIQWHNGALWIVASLSNRVNRVDPDEGTILGSYDLGVNRNPMQVAFSGEHAFVTNLLANTVSVLRLQ
jgi:DNA-binding beta-propeller fold protein YncE